MNGSLLIPGLLAFTAELWYFQVNVIESVSR